MGNNREKVLVAMSGGVDSSVAAALLVSDGADVAGATMLLHGGETGAAEDAKRVCDKLGIAHYTLDLREEFRAVTEDFVKTYLHGGTPNPCVVCNKLVKFGAFVRAAERLGFALTATGHYARTRRAGNRTELLRGADAAKDQSYVLWRLGGDALSRVLFPVGEYPKPEIRALARSFGLEIADKPDSQDVCFIPGGDYVSYIERETGEKYPSGDYLDMSGKVIGRHEGAIKYTPGQRRGVGTGFGERVYVINKDMEKNTVTLGPDSALMSRTVSCTDANFISGAPPEDDRVTAKIRYSRGETAGTLVMTGETAFRVEFDEPVRAPSPGQSCVLYRGEVLLGGGVITR